MSASQIFASLVGLAMIGFAVTVIEHARAAIRSQRAAEIARKERVSDDPDMAAPVPHRLRG